MATKGGPRGRLGDPALHTRDATTDDDVMGDTKRYEGGVDRERGGRRRTSGRARERVSSFVFFLSFPGWEVRPAGPDDPERPVAVDRFGVFSLGGLS